MIQTDDLTEVLSFSHSSVSSARRIQNICFIWQNKISAQYGENDTSFYEQQRAVEHFLPATCLKRRTDRSVKMWRSDREVARSHQSSGGGEGGWVVVATSFLEIHQLTATPAGGHWKRQEMGFSVCGEVWNDTLSFTWGEGERRGGVMVLWLSRRWSRWAPTQTWEQVSPTAAAEPGRVFGVQTPSGALRAELPAVLAHTDGPSCVEDLQSVSHSVRLTAFLSPAPTSIPSHWVSSQSRVSRKSCSPTLWFPLTLHHALTALLLSCSKWTKSRVW